MSVRMPKRKNLPPHWGQTAAFIMLVVLLCFALFAGTCVPPRIHPLWLALLLCAGILVLGIGVGLLVAPGVVPYLRYMMVSEALERERDRVASDDTGDRPSLPEGWLRVPGYPVVAGSLLWLLASLAAMGGGAAVGFIATGELRGGGILVCLVGFGIGWFIVPWLRLISQFKA